MLNVSLLQILLKIIMVAKQENIRTSSDNYYGASIYFCMIGIDIFILMMRLSLM